MVPPEPLPTVLNVYVSRFAVSGKPTAPSSQNAQTLPKNRQRALQTATPKTEKRTLHMVKRQATIRTNPPKEKLTDPKPIFRIPKIQNTVQSESPVRRQPLEPNMPLATAKNNRPSRMERPRSQSLKNADRRTPPIATPENTLPIVPLGQTSGGLPHPSGTEKRPGTERQARAPDWIGSPVVQAEPNYAVNPKPPYPRLAIRRGYEGTVTLLIEVLADGSVREVEILSSSGYSILDRSALKTVRKWRFIPGRRGQKPVTTKVKVPVVFRLKKPKNG
jgi:TonB family protein